MKMLETLERAKHKTTLSRTMKHGSTLKPTQKAGSEMTSPTLSIKNSTAVEPSRRIYKNRWGMAPSTDEEKARLLARVTGMSFKEERQPIRGGAKIDLSKKQINRNLQKTVDCEATLEQTFLSFAPELKDQLESTRVDFLLNRSPDETDFHLP